MAGKIDRMWVNKEIALFNRTSGAADRETALPLLGELADKIIAHLRIPAERKEEMVRFLEMSSSELGTIETDAAEIWDNFFSTRTTPPVTPTQAVESLLSEEEPRRVLKLSGHNRVIPINRSTGEAEDPEQAIPNGTMVMFDANGMGHDEFGSDIAKHSGEVFKVLSLELDYPESDGKENEYYTLELNGKQVYHAISGSHLTPVALPPARPLSTRPMDTRR